MFNLSRDPTKPRAEGSCNLRSRDSSLYVTILPSLAATGIVKIMRYSRNLFLVWPLILQDHMIKRLSNLKGLSNLR